MKPLIPHSTNNKESNLSGLVNCDGWSNDIILSAKVLTPYNHNWQMKGQS